MNSEHHQIAMSAGLFESSDFCSLTEEQQEVLIRATRQAIFDEQRLGRRRVRPRVVIASVTEEMEVLYGGVIALAVLVAVISWCVQRLLDRLVDRRSEGTGAGEQRIIG